MEKGEHFGLFFVFVEEKEQTQGKRSKLGFSPVDQTTFLLKVVSLHTNTESTWEDKEQTKEQSKKNKGKGTKWSLCIQTQKVLAKTRKSY